jgi:hypothetical protein
MFLLAGLWVAMSMGCALVAGLGDDVPRPDVGDAASDGGGDSASDAGDETPIDTTDAMSSDGVASDVQPDGACVPRSTVNEIRNPSFEDWDDAGRAPLQWETEGAAVLHMAPGVDCARAVQIELNAWGQLTQHNIILSKPLSPTGKLHVFAKARWVAGDERPPVFGVSFITTNAEGGPDWRLLGSADFGLLSSSGAWITLDTTIANNTGQTIRAIEVELRSEWLPTTIDFDDTLLEVLP